MGVRRLFRAASPYNASELVDVDAVQSFDVMYLAHLNHPPRRLDRLDHTKWAFSNVAFGPTIEPPTGVAVQANNPNQDQDNQGNAYFPQTQSYRVSAIDAATGQESRPSEVVSCSNDLSLKRNFNTITWAAKEGADRYRLFKANNNGDFGYLGATEKLSFIDDQIGPDLTLGPLEGRNPFAEPGDYPATVTFFEQRTWWAQSLNNPNGMWSSRSADLENMDVSVPLRADDAISIRLVSQGVNKINQLVPLDQLLAFASDGLFKIEGSNEDYLSASPPPRNRRQLGSGSSRLEPLVIESIALYKTTNGEQVRALGFRFERDGFASNDVTIFSPHFFQGFDIVSWCYAENPLSMVWAARSDGALLAFVWEQEHDVWGWTICPLAGDGKVRSLCSVREFGEDRVYAIIERTIAGEVRYCRERMASARQSRPSTDSTDRPAFHWECHLDCAVTQVFDEPSGFVDGLWHLEGETVAAFADGIVHEGLVVNQGRLVLPEGHTATLVHVGLPFDAVVETLPLNFQTQAGTSQGRNQATGKAVVKLAKSRAPMVGISEGRLRPLKVERPFGDMRSEASLLNGIFPVTTDPVNRLESTATIQHRIAPLTVTAVYLDTEVSD